MQSRARRRIDARATARGRAGIVVRQVNDGTDLAGGGDAGYDRAAGEAEKCVAHCGFSLYKAAYWTAML